MGSWHPLLLHILGMGAGQTVVTVANYGRVVRGLPPKRVVRGNPPRRVVR
jgi:hypothetical protein